MNENEERELLIAAIIAALPEVSLEDLQFIYCYITAP